MAILAVIVPPSFFAQPKLVWNASASVPIGLYRVSPTNQIAIGDLVAVVPPEPITEFMTERGYIGRGVLLLKHVAALPGQEICRVGDRITVDAEPYGTALDHDRLGRPLPVWQGCRRIARGEVFLMNRDVGDSFDGRYFGPIAARSIVGLATAIHITVSNGRRIAPYFTARDRTIEKRRSRAGFFSCQI
jgi:conjugative transfer signal peptidase TraF